MVSMVMGILAELVVGATVVARVVVQVVIVVTATVENFIEYRSYHKKFLHGELVRLENHVLNVSSEVSCSLCLNRTDMGFS